MKKIICILISLSLVLSLAACSSKSKKDETTATTATSSESTSITAAASTTGATTAVEVPTKKGEKVTLGYVESETLTLGEITGNSYENKSAGFRIEDLGDDWKETDVAQIAQAFDGGKDQETGKAIYSISEDGSLYYICDVMYVNVENESVVSVSLLQNEKGQDLTDIVLEDEGNALVKGFKNTNELMYVNIAGKKAVCKKINYTKTKNFAKIPNITEYDIFFMTKDKKQAIKVVIVSLDPNVSLEDIAAHFVAV